MKVYWRWGGGILHSFVTMALKWSADFPTQATLPSGTDLLHPSNKRLGRPQIQSGHSGEQENLLPLPEIKTRLSILQPSYHNNYTIPAGDFTTTGAAIFVTKGQHFDTQQRFQVRHPRCVQWTIRQGAHKNTPWFQVVIKSKLTGIFLQNWWLVV
jgi:hypothetical protein